MVSVTRKRREKSESREEQARDRKLSGQDIPGQIKKYRHSKYMLSEQSIRSTRNCTRYMNSTNNCTRMK